MTPAGKTTDKITRAAAEKASGLLQEVRSRARGGGDDDGPLTRRQSLTFHRTDVPTLERFFEDPVILDEVGGTVAGVERTGTGTYTWRFARPGGGDPIEIPTTLESLPGLLRWTSMSDDEGSTQRAEVRLTPAPNDLGTEVTFEIEAQPSALVPETLTKLALGGAMYKALYRARALAQTSEVPTLRHNPAARNGGADHDED